MWSITGSSESATAHSSAFIHGDHELRADRVNINPDTNAANQSGDTILLTGEKQERFAVNYSRELIFENYFEKSKIPSDLSDPASSGLSEDDREMIRELKDRDHEVRMHEQTHAALLGPYARSAPSYTYQVGPDGRMYAVGGSVEVDTGKEATPEETANKARILQIAATSVKEPSPADMAVAAGASGMLSEAMAQMVK
jgi:hypothetical protein